MRMRGQKEAPMVPRGLVWPVRHRLDVDCVVQRRGATRPGIVVGVALDHVLVEWDDGRTIEAAASLVLADMAQMDPRWLDWLHFCGLGAKHWRVASRWVAS